MMPFRPNGFVGTGNPWLMESMKRGCNMNIFDRVLKALPSWYVSTSSFQFVVDIVRVLPIFQPTNLPPIPILISNLQHEVLPPRRHCRQLARCLSSRFFHWRWSLLIDHQRRYAMSESFRQVSRTTNCDHWLTITRFHHLQRYRCPE